MVLSDFLNGLQRIFTGDPEIWGIALLSIIVSGTAVSLASLIGIPLGIWMGRSRRMNGIIPTTVLNTLMGLPPVLIGLVVFLILASEGPLGSLQLIFTPMAMVIAQFVLTLPIVVGLTKSAIANLPEELPALLKTLGASQVQLRAEIWKEARAGIIIGVITALGRAFSEVGAVLIVGGNLKGYTRILTTAIVTETSKGNYGVSLALGTLLFSISLILTGTVTFLQIRLTK
ncbi:MAG: ABC transporter permease subunit [Methanobacteriota archaeon]|nr:MAG: ABC transporter permease subunit [Euryarchaeota archaeon]